MKKIIIVSPHFPPSNLAAVHRSRLFAKHLPTFGWEPIIVTVHHNFYEEELDWNLHELTGKNIRVESAKALHIKPVKLVGDVGIRGFWGMYKKIIKLIKTENIDFLYIPIPSNYAALLGRLVYEKTHVPYGIDYIDPWVHQWPGTEKKFSKAWWSMKFADWLEPFAIKKATLISGVAPGYYGAVLERNPHLKKQAVTVAMPYGGEKDDHLFVKSKQIKPYLFEKKDKVLDFVYAGAMLPKAFEPLRQLLKSIKNNKADFEHVRFHFIGTGKSPNDAKGYNIKPIAKEFGLYGSIVFEYPKRIPYLDVLAHLDAADGAFILGSTEAHYTPSKVYQSVLSGKPIFAILHQASTAAKVIEETGAGITLTFEGEPELQKIELTFMEKWEAYQTFLASFDVKNVNLETFNKYSAKSVTEILVDALNKIIDGGK